MFHKGTVQPQGTGQASKPTQGLPAATKFTPDPSYTLPQQVIPATLKLPGQKDQHGTFTPGGPDSAGTFQPDPINSSTGMLFRIYLVELHADTECYIYYAIFI